MFAFFYFGGCVRIGVFLLPRVSIFSFIYVLFFFKREMTNQFINREAADWAERNLVGRIEIKPLYNSLLSKVIVGLAIGFLLLVFLGIPALIFYSAGVRYLAQGWTGEVSRGFTFGSIFLLAVIVFAAVIIFYLWRLRRNQVIRLTSEGVYTRGGKIREWKQLQYLKFESVDTEVRDVYLRAMTRAMYASVQKIKVEMFFSNAAEPAVIPPLIANQRKILELLKTIPVESRP